METEDEKTLRQKKAHADALEAELANMLNSAQSAVDKARSALKKVEAEQAGRDQAKT